MAFLSTGTTLIVKDPPGVIRAKVIPQRKCAAMNGFDVGFSGSSQNETFATNAYFEVVRAHPGPSRVFSRSGDARPDHAAVGRSDAGSDI